MSRVYRIVNLVRDHSHAAVVVVPDCGTGTDLCVAAFSVECNQKVSAVRALSSACDTN